LRPAQATAVLQQVVATAVFSAARCHSLVRRNRNMYFVCTGTARGAKVRSSKNNIIDAALQKT
jgi:hypothetical protein